MIFGLGAALGWGLADFTVALVSRRIGSFATLMMAQLGGLAVFASLLALPSIGLPHFQPGLLVIPLIGVGGALSYVAFYRALELGPIALVSPIAAGYAAIVIALALLFLGESVAALALGGAAVAIVGVVLASSDFRQLGRQRPRSRGGAFYAVLAMIGFGVASFLIGAYAQDVGWYGTILLSRLGSAVTLGALLAVIPTRPVRRVRRVAVVASVLAGTLDILGFAAFARGGELGHVSITAAASVTYPLIPILAGVLYFRERPAPSQGVGVVMVLGGLVLLTFGR